MKPFCVSVVRMATALGNIANCSAKMVRCALWTVHHKTGIVVMTRAVWQPARSKIHGSEGNIQDVLMCIEPHPWGHPHRCSADRDGCAQYGGVYGCDERIEVFQYVIVHKNIIYLTLWSHSNTFNLALWSPLQY